jgi:hypothetical protein
MATVHVGANADSHLSIILACSTLRAIKVEDTLTLHPYEAPWMGRHRSPRARAQAIIESCVRGGLFSSWLLPSRWSAWWLRLGRLMRP